MIYNINLGKWNSVFAVPSEFVDKYIVPSNEAQIKVFLWMLRHGGEKLGLSEMADSLKLTQEEVKKSVIYWQERDLISESEYEENSGFKETCNSSVSKNICLNESPKKETSRYQRPNSFSIASRIESSTDIHFLMQEAQVILGRPISNGDSAALLMLHDNDGLPIDVIIMLLQYAVSIGKANIKYIEKTGINWASEGIDDLERAEKKIQSLNQANIAWKRFENIIGIYHRSPSAREEEAVSRWFDEWNYSDELIKEAYDRCVNANGKYVLKYMDSIVKRWRNQGIVTLEQALMENSARKGKKSFSKEDNKASYSIDEYENYNIFDYINN